MTAEAKLRESICWFAKSLFERGLTSGTSGNISARTADGGLLVTPSGSSFGKLDPRQLSFINSSGEFVSGDAPTKEMSLHQAFYQTRGAKTGAVVHLHSTYSVALSILPDANPDNVLPPLTAYSVMKLGKVKLLPYFRPGDPKMGDAVIELDGKHAAVLLANHGPVVSGLKLEDAVYAVEELEETARLSLITRGCNPTLLTQEQIADLVKTFGVDWD